MGFREALDANLGIFKTAIAGRACRSQYWNLVWVHVLLMLALVVVGALLGFMMRFIPVLPVLLNFAVMFGFMIYAFVLLCVGPAVTVRRLHDLDKSGWWFLIVFIPVIGAIILFVWFCMKGTTGDNRFGPDPLAQVATDA